MLEDEKLYDENYFRGRIGNDPLRQKSFLLEKKFLEKNIGIEVQRIGKILDVGCSTGEFIEALKWPIQDAYGMEIAEVAKRIATGKGVQFTRDITNSKNFFDLIVYRGTVQHLPSPFEYLAMSYSALRNGGHVVFFVTPNAASLYYRYFKTLPFLEGFEKMLYWIPDETSLCMNLRNVGFRIVKVEYPYLRSPYSSFFADHLKFARKLLFRTSDRFAFWGNIMTVLAKKDRN